MAKKGDKPDWLDDEDLDGDDALSADDLFVEEKPAKTPMLKRGGGRDEPPPREERPAPRAESPKHSPAEEEKHKEAGAIGRMLIKQQKRPGEQEILKSPLVLSLFGGILVLLVMAMAFWFIIGRDATTRELETIDAAIAEQRYSYAIERLKEFLLKHGRDSYTEPAMFKLAKVRIDAQVGGSTPNWPEGLKALNQFIDDCRDFPKYPEQYPTLLDYSKQISLGALETATRTKDRNLLKVSEDAELMIDRFSNPEQPQTALHEEIRIARERTIDAIRKHETTLATYAEIQKLLDGRKPIEALKSRRRLLDRYPDLDRDAKLTSLLQATLDTERKLVAAEEVNRDASREDRPLPVPAPLSLTLHTRALSDESSEGRTVFSVAQGCCYGVDTVTGDPVWRRAIGPDAPFFPVVVDTTVPGLLLFDTTHQELVLLNRLTGQLVWRQPLDEAVSGAPLVHEGQAYVPTLGNHLYKVDLQTGLVSSRLSFSQPVYSPPVLTRDGQHLVVAGDEAVSYVLTVRPLECLKVSFTGQRPGAIDVPMLAMGNLILMIENDQLGQALLRVLSAAAPDQGLTEAAATRLQGLVRDVPVLRGNQLFVPAEGEQFNIFTVSDASDKEPLLPIAKPPAASQYSGAVHVLAGADGRMWSASDSLRQFQLTQDSLLEDQKKKLYLGASGQPLQSIGKNLFVGRRQLESDAISLLLVDGEDMTSQWRTVLGAGALALLPKADGATLVLTRSGDLFQLSQADLAASGFRFRAEGSLPLPDGLDQPLVASVLPGRRIAVACGGKSPRLWIVNEAGKVAQEFPLEEPPAGPLVPLAGGVVVTLPTKLRLLGAPAGVVEDYLGTVEKQEQSQWAHLLPIDDNHFLLIDRAGRMSRIQYRTTPKAHLQPVDTLEAGQPVDVPPLLADGKIVVADAGGRLQVLNPAGFERVAETRLKAPAIGTGGVAGQRLLLETSDGQLNCFDLSQELKPLWSASLNGDHMTGAPVLEGTQLVFATLQGRVMSFHADTGEAGKALQLDAALEQGPIRVGPHLIVTSTDGSLYRVESIAGGSQ